MFNGPSRSWSEDANKRSVPVPRLQKKQRDSTSKAGRFAYDQKQTGGQNADRHLMRAKLMRDFSFAF
jgi:hypothetical protein